MHADIEERFEIRAPLDAVWGFLMDPHRVAACMPGATLEEVEDARTFRGTIRLKVGFVSVGYRVRARFTEVDPDSHSATLEAEGEESAGGGTVKGTLRSRSRALPDGVTEVTAEVSMELSGRMMEFGRGMFRSLSRQLTRKFAACAREHLEPPPEAAAPER